MNYMVIYAFFISYCGNSTKPVEQNAITHKTKNAIPTTSLLYIIRRWMRILLYHSTTLKWCRWLTKKPHLMMFINKWYTIAELEILIDNVPIEETTKKSLRIWTFISNFHGKTMLCLYRLRYLEEWVSLSKREKILYKPTLLILLQIYRSVFHIL